ncbi:MAG: nitroreductase family protein [Gammaproteobacteria bacterium]
MTSDAPARLAGEALNQLLRERRTVHDFTDAPVPAGALEAALEVARWAPNHHRTEPWRVYALGPRAQREIALLNADRVRAARGDRAAEVKLKRWLAMPGWFVMNVVRSDDPLRAQEDYAACCCAAQNLMLSLWGAGLGSKWTTGAVVRTPEFSDIVGFDPAAEDVVGLFWFGWPAAVGEQRRRPVEDFLTYVD